MKKLNIAQMLIFILAFGLSFTACSNSSGGSSGDIFGGSSSDSSDNSSNSNSNGSSSDNNQEWKNVENIEQAKGAWKLSLNNTKDAKEVLEDFLGKEIDAQTEAAIGKDMKAIYDVDIFSTVNASKKVIDALTKTTVSLSGTNTALFWPMFKAMFIEYYNADQFDVDDSNYSMTRTNISEPLSMTEDVDGFYLAEIIYSMQINSDGTKLKYISGKIKNNELSDTIDNILIMFDVEEAIFEKQ